MLKIATAKIKMKEKTFNLTYTTFTKHELLQNNFFRRAMPLCNTILQKSIDNAQSHENMKNKLKQYFHRLIHEGDWRDRVKNVRVSIVSNRKHSTVLFF